MTGRTPPKLATFLLKQLGCAPDTDAIIGDLTEGYGCGQTTGWYWKQVLSAIAAGAFNDIRSHKLLALRAIVAGILVTALFEALEADNVGLAELGADLCRELARRIDLLDNADFS